MSRKYGRAYTAAGIVNLLEKRLLRYGFNSKLRVEKSTYVRIGLLGKFPLVELLNSDIYLLDEGSILGDNENAL